MEVRMWGTVACLDWRRRGMLLNSAARSQRRAAFHCSSCVVMGGFLTASLRGTVLWWLLAGVRRVHVDAGPATRPMQFLPTSSSRGIAHEHDYDVPDSRSVLDGLMKTTGN